MSVKPSISRLARVETGSRPSLPGQDPKCEAELRIEFTELLKPQGLIEKRWIEDIAYRNANLDMIRARIAGLQHRLIHSVLDRLRDRARRAVSDRADNPGDPYMWMPELSPWERDVLERWEQYSLTPRDLTNFLADPQFAWLLGSVSGKDMPVLRSLQTYEQEEVRERDRIINQFDRRRRLAARHAIELAEAKQRGCLPEGLDVPRLTAQGSGCDSEAGREACCETSAQGGNELTAQRRILTGEVKALAFQSSPGAEEQVAESDAGDEHSELNAGDPGDGP